MRKLLAAVAFLALAACTDKITDPFTGSIAGTFSLRTLNGSSLPYSIPGSVSNRVVTSDVVTMNDNGTWSEVYSYRSNGSSNVVSDNYAGYFDRTGVNITLYSGNSVIYDGSFDGQRMLLTSGNYTFVFSR